MEAAVQVIRKIDSISRSSTLRSRGNGKSSFNSCPQELEEREEVAVASSFHVLHLSEPP